MQTQTRTRIDFTAGPQGRAFPCVIKVDIEPEREPNSEATLKATAWCAKRGWSLIRVDQVRIDKADPYPQPLQEASAPTRRLSPIVVWIAALLMTLSVLALGSVDPYTHPVKATLTDLACLAGVLLSVGLLALSAGIDRPED